MGTKTKIPRYICEKANGGLKPPPYLQKETVLALTCKPSKTYTAVQTLLRLKNLSSSAAEDEAPPNKPRSAGPSDMYFEGGRMHNYYPDTTTSDDDGNISALGE